MTFVHFIFYVFAITAVFSSAMVVGSNNPVRSALFLVLTFFCMAGIWILLHAEFLALILVLVYVGAVMTLFLFVVMMLKLDGIGLREGFVRYLPWAVLMILMIVGLVVMVVGPAHFGLLQMPTPPATAADFSNVANLGMVLYSDYAYPFEIAAVILLAAIVAAIGLTHREAKNRKNQNIVKQISVRPEDRIRIIKDM